MTHGFRCEALLTANHQISSLLVVSELQRSLFLALMLLLCMFSYPSGDQMSAIRIEIRDCFDLVGIFGWSP